MRAIRLDSGDLGRLAFDSRRLLDEAGLSRVKIFASSGLDEHEIQRLVEMAAPIDGFGVGTKLAVSRDAPDLDFVYKLVSYGGEPRTKLSTEKRIYPGRKQVFRHVEGGKLVGDVLGRHDERLPGQPLLRPVMRHGERLPAGSVSLESARRHAMQELNRLPDPLRSLKPAGKTHPVRISDALTRQIESLMLKWKQR